MLAVTVATHILLLHELTAVVAVLEAVPDKHKRWISNGYSLKKKMKHDVQQESMSTPVGPTGDEDLPLWSAWIWFHTDHLVPLDPHLEHRPISLSVGPVLCLHKPFVKSFWHLIY